MRRDSSQDERLAVAEFDRWRPWVIAGLVIAACLLAAFWAIWWIDRGLIASSSKPSYYAFEGAFALADGWLFVAVLAAAIQLSRRRASALLWLLAAGGAGLYLLGMDVLYDVQHGIYGNSRGGAIELPINVLTAAASVAVLWWSWRHRGALLAPSTERGPKGSCSTS